MAEDFIFQGMLQDDSICDDLINFHKTNPQSQFPGTTFKGVDKSVKDSIDVALSYPNPLLINYSDQLKLLVNQYFIKYHHAEPFGPWGMTQDASIQFYHVGGGFHKYHYERSCGLPPESKRFLVFMTYLNDVTDGGQTEFVYQNVLIQPKKGLTVIWPTDWTHTHRGIPSQSQTKYIITGWLSFID